MLKYHRSRGSDMFVVETRRYLGWVLRLSFTLVTPIWIRSRARISPGREQRGGPRYGLDRDDRATHIVVGSVLQRIWG